MKMSFANACKTYLQEIYNTKIPSHKLKIKGNVSSVNLSESMQALIKKQTVRSPGTDGLFCFSLLYHLFFQRN